MSKLRPLLLFGTRPEAIKMAPVIHECRRRPGAIEPIVAAAGQHRELLEPMVGYFELRPDRRLDVMRPGQPLAELTSASLLAIDSLLAELKPDCLVVQGDTTTVMAASLAAFYRSVPLAHVEAGLRTGSLSAPWPEELNRRTVSLSAALHFAPTRRAADALRAEGVPPAAVHVTGNTVVDALLWTLARERGRAEHWEREYAMLGPRRLVLITGHRRENFGAGLQAICHAIATLAERFPDVEFLYPVHLNPNILQPVRAALSGRRNVHLTEPAAYPEFVWLMSRSTLIITDSGGVQEEAPSLCKPVLVTREATERPEAVEAGAAVLVGASSEAIVGHATRLLTDDGEYARRQAPANPYGDGQAARRIVDVLQTMRG
ncbi:MAG: UDP-N-acetylglucosamine 2-epimerase (non-hydrolyzing) [Planctomycetes bacterium]|nr:UDP-N-acetylglucosamine 2-epimerase (non-hydrolyzing) [Planctomycetota bacterium]